MCDYIKIVILNSCVSVVTRVKVVLHNVVLQQLAKRPEVATKPVTSSYLTAGSSSPDGPTTSVKKPESNSGLSVRLIHPDEDLSLVGYGLITSIYF